MNFYSWEHGALIEKKSLWEALKLSTERHRVISLTGGGGKTSVMFRLADELAERGKTVIVTTTTHIFNPSDRNVVETDRAADVEAWLERRGRDADRQGSGRTNGIVLVAGLPAAEGKLKSMPLAEAVRLKALADVLLIEADGAKRLPIKVPRDGEPVILDCTDVVIGCMGLDCIGGELEEYCFRTELAAGLLGVEKGPDGHYRHRITSGDAARILTSKDGTRKLVGGRDYRVILNKADDESLLRTAAETAKEMERRYPVPCAVSCFRS